MIPILPLLMNFNWKMVLRIAAGLVIAYLIWMALDWVRDKDQAVLEAQAKIAELKVVLEGERRERMEAELERDSANAEIARINVFDERMTILQEEITKEQQATRTQVASFKGMLDSHNFEELSAKKPGLMTIKVNKATKDTFDEIEDSINSTD